MSLGVRGDGGQDRGHRVQRAAGQEAREGTFFTMLGFSSLLKIKSELRNKTRATYSRPLGNMEER